MLLPSAIIRQYILHRPVFGGGGVGGGGVGGGGVGGSGGGGGVGGGEDG